MACCCSCSLMAGICLANLVDAGPGHRGGRARARSAALFRQRLALQTGELGLQRVTLGHHVFVPTLGLALLPATIPHRCSSTPSEISPVSGSTPGATAGDGALSCGAMSCAAPVKLPAVGVCSAGAVRLAVAQPASTAMAAALDSSRHWGPGPWPEREPALAREPLECPRPGLPDT